MLEPTPERPQVRRRERQAVLQALRAGVVPRSGLQHIQVGRSAELDALLRDVEHARDAGSSVRFVIGEYGSGKTFFLNLIRLVALEQGLVTVHADLTPDKRLQATGGHARALYAELMRNLSTRTKPDGGALPALVERFVSQATADARAGGGDPEALIRERLGSLEELVSGYDFARVVAHYWRANEAGDAETKAAELRWLRGEYPNRTAAKRDLDVSTVIDDANWYDYLKLMGRFVRLAGYGGLVVVVDEMVNLYKLNHQTARSRNYEQVLRIVNDSLQGLSEGVLFLFGGTPEFLMDPYRGLYSYEALQSRLVENRFATDGLVDLTGPVLRLQSLSPEDLYVLLGNIRRVFAEGDEGRHLVPDAALEAFMRHCAGRVGDAYFRTPRNTVRAFADLLAVLEQNPSASWEALLGAVELAEERNPDLEPIPDEPEGLEADGTAPGGGPDEAGDDADDLASFRL
jgi:hypothetical protein